MAHTDPHHPDALRVGGYAIKMDRASGRRPYIFATVFLAAVGVAALLWMVYAAPGYTERERETRNENAAMEKDIAEIEAMAGTTEEIDKRIRDAENRIGEKYQGRSVTDKDAASLVGEVCSNVGVDETGIDIGKARMLSPAGTYAAALYAADVTVMFEGTEKKGAAVIRGLENSRIADFEITAFIFRAIPPEEDYDEKPSTVVPPEIGEWVITAVMYYYEQEEL